MLDNKAINKKIGSIKKSTTTVRANVQEVLCNVAGHAYEYGDVRGFDKLLAVSTGLSKSRIVRWVHEYGFARYNEKTGTFKTNSKMLRETMFGNGANTDGSGNEVVKYLVDESANWYEMTAGEASTDKPLDITQSLVALRKRIDKATEKGQEILSEDFHVAMRLLEAKVEGLTAVEIKVA